MRILLPLCVVVILLCVSVGSADLVTPRKVWLAGLVPGQGTRVVIERYKPNDAATVILSGNGDTTVLGLYVFDAEGNCVAKDDRTTLQNTVDLGLEWVPANTTPYYIEVRNAGVSEMSYKLVLR